MTKKIHQLMPLIILALAITLFPSFIVGKLPDGRDIEIRLEDILLVIMIIASFCFFLFSAKTKIEKPPLFFLILTWLAVGFFTLLINLILLNRGFAKGILYFLKEVEFFFLYLYVFFRLKNIDSAKFMVKLWGILMLANVGYVLYQYLFHVRYGEYGTAALSEWGVFPTGAFFLISFIFLFNFFLYDILTSELAFAKKIFWSFVALSPVLGIFGSYSKTNLVGFFFALLITLFLLIIKMRNLKMVLIFLLMIAVISVFFFIFLSNVRKSQRMEVMLSLTGGWESYKLARWNTTIIQELEKVLTRPLYVIFVGVGKGYGETHNQYVRNLVETGILGSVVFLILVFAIIGKAWKEFFKSRDTFLTGLAGGFLIATLTMLFIGLATEPFLTVKPAETYWFFSAIAMAVLSLEKKQKNISKNPL